MKAILEIGRFLGIIIVLIILIEGYLYVHFKYGKNLKKAPLFIIGFPILIGFLYFSFKIVNISATHEPLTAIYPVLIKVILYSLLIEAIIFFLIRNVLYKYMVPVLLIAPGFIGLVVLIVIPFIFEFYLAFVDLRLNTLKEWITTGRIHFVGVNNFIRIFTSSVLVSTPTWWLIIRNFIYMAENVFFQVTIGMGLALLLNRKMKGRGFYRTILILPWAVPSVISILALKQEFAPTYGLVNIILMKITEWFPFLSGLHLSEIPWRFHSFWTFAMVSMVNIWLGIPFCMVVILGGMQSISPEYYDAAVVDGASYSQNFRYITLPLLKPVLVPVILLGSIWTFNSINVVYLMTGGLGAGAQGVEYADLILTAVYKASFIYFNYSLGAALGIIIVIVLLIFTIIWLRLTRGTEKVY